MNRWNLIKSSFSHQNVSLEIEFERQDEMNYTQRKKSSSMNHEAVFFK